MNTEPNPQPTTDLKKVKPGRAPLRWPWAFALFILLLVLPAWMLVDINHRIDWRFSVTYFSLLSILTFSFYWSDKRKAKADGWRIPESTLHLMEVLGGWPAALVAQRFLRHKTKKRSYQSVFWLIIFLHELLALELVSDWFLSRSLVNLFR